MPVLPGSLFAEEAESASLFAEEVESASLVAEGVEHAPRVPAAEMMAAIANEARMVLMLILSCGCPRGAG